MFDMTNYKEKIQTLKKSAGVSIAVDGAGGEVNYIVNSSTSIRNVADLAFFLLSVVKELEQALEEKGKPEDLDYKEGLKKLMTAAQVNSTTSMCGIKNFYSLAVPLHTNPSPINLALYSLEVIDRLERHIGRLTTEKKPDVLKTETEVFSEREFDSAACLYYHRGMADTKRGHRIKIIYANGANDSAPVVGINIANGDVHRYSEDGYMESSNDPDLRLMTPKRDVIVSYYGNGQEAYQFDSLPDAQEYDKRAPTSLVARFQLEI